MNEKRIILFDDDKDILTICSYILQSLGWTVFTMDNCNNIIEKIEETQPDVIVMDNWVPDTGGIVATQTIKAHPVFRNIPVIFFSANHDIKNLSEQAGADTYIMKPFDIKQFEQVINSVCKPSKAS